MDIKRDEYSFKSSTGLYDIFARSWSPADPAEVKGIFQIAHGMAEHGERYESFAKALCEKGFAVFADDHAGHGKSINTEDDLGYFGEKDGWMDFVIDCRTLTDIAREKFPDVPVVFFGHSMGSFIARSYTAKYNDVDAAIYCGTSGKNPAAPIAIQLASFIAKSKGSHYRSQFIDKLAFGGYNKKIDAPQSSFDWLSRDDEQVKKYIADDLCGFLFTAAGYRDLFSVLNSVSGKDWYRQLSTEYPLLVVSGSMDPVGEYSKGVQHVADELKESGHNVTLKLFEGGRHEILNETNREEVENFISSWAADAIGISE